MGLILIKTKTMKDYFRLPEPDDTNPPEENEEPAVDPDPK